MPVKFNKVNFRYKSEGGYSDALRDVDFEVSKGGICGLLGPNGAGKTTLIRCASGLIKPQSGIVELFGTAPSRENLGRIGILIENPGIYRRLKAREFLKYFGELYGLKNIRDRISELTETFKLDFMSKPMGKLSIGQKQKIQLVRSLLNHPSLILWDEPFSNLDPVSQKQFQNYLRQYIRTADAAAVIATHQLNQAEEFCTDFAFINGGKMIYQGSTGEVRNDLKKDSNIEAVFLHAPGPALLEKVLDRFALKLDTSERDSVSGSVTAVFSGMGAGEKIPDVIAAFINSGFKLTAVKSGKKTLYEFYCGLIQK